MLLLCFDNPLQLQVTSPSRFALLCFFVVVLRQITVEQPKRRAHTRAHLVVCFVSVNWRGCRCAGGGPRGPGPVDQREESLIQGTLDWYRGITGIFQRFLRDGSAGFFFCCCSRENEENVPLVRPLGKKKEEKNRKAENSPDVSRKKGNVGGAGRSSPKMWPPCSGLECNSEWERGLETPSHVHGIIYHASSFPLSLQASGCLFIRSNQKLQK